MTHSSFKAEHGRLLLRFNKSWPWRTWVEVRGGPYSRFPGCEKFFGVCVRAENAPKNDEMDVWLPLHDYDVPRSPKLLDIALRRTLKQLLNPPDRRMVWVGCAGGYGRTGLFLALLAKISNSHAPVTCVREGYCASAIETMEQLEFILDFDVKPYRRYAMVEGLKGWLRRTFRF